MPHVLVKLWPGKSEEQKQQLAKRITEEVMSVLGSGEASISVAFEEVAVEDWGKVYRQDIMAAPERLFKKPGYSM